MHINRKKSPRFFRICLDFTAPRTEPFYSSQPLANYPAKAHGRDPPKQQLIQRAQREMRRQTSSSAPCTTHDDRIPCNESDRLASATPASYTLHRDTRQQDRRLSRRNHRLLHHRRQRRSGRRPERELGMLRGTWWFRFV